MIPAVSRLVKSARAASVDIVHATFERRVDNKGANVNARLFAALADTDVKLMRGSEAAKIVPEVGVEPTDLVLVRTHGLNPMSGTELEPVLRNMGVSTIVVAGVSVNVGSPPGHGGGQPGLRRGAAQDAVCGVPADYAAAVIDNTLALLATLTTVDELVTIWERDAVRFCQSLMFSSPDDWIALTQVAERAGFDQVSLSDHVFYPDKLDSSYPYTPDGKPMFPPDTPWPDVWVMVGAMAAGDRAHRASPPTCTCCRCATRSSWPRRSGPRPYLSGDRVPLGVGVGWMREEFDLARAALRAPRRPHGRDDRGAAHAVARRHGRAPRRALRLRPPRDAPGAEQPVPILVGGHTDVALRRAAASATAGWASTTASTSCAATSSGCRATATSTAPTTGPSRSPASIIDPLPTPDVCAELDEMGVTTLITSAWLIEGRPSGPATTTCGRWNLRRALHRSAA